MLRNDMRRIIESHCRIHGYPGGGPAFSSCLISLVACETVGLLVSADGLIGPRATRAFLRFVGTTSDDPRYQQLAGPIFGLFRHGIAHSFMPKRYQLPDGSAIITAGTAWQNRPDKTSRCVKWLSSKAGAEKVNRLRTGHHLRVLGSPPYLQLIIAPQVLFLDVDRALAAVKGKLLADSELQTIVTRNFTRWTERLESLDAKWINEEERAFIVSPPKPRIVVRNASPKRDRRAT
jgi:hypothetical protein